MTVDLGEVLERSGAVLHGHFLLTSGRHSDIYFEKFRVLEQPKVLTELCAPIADRFRGGVDVVAGPTTGGIIVAFEVARQLGVNAVYVESEDGARKLRRGATIDPAARTLVVDDVLTTGKSLRETLELVRGVGGTPIGVACLIDRAESQIDFGVPLYASHRVDARSYSPTEVPDWLAALPLTKPGTSSQMQPFR